MIKLFAFVLVLFSGVASAQQSPDTYFSAVIDGQTRYSKEAASLAQQALAGSSYAQCGTSEDKCYWTFKECKPWTGSQWTCTATRQYYDGSPAPSVQGVINPFINYCTTAKPWFEPSIGGCSDKPPQKTCDAGKAGSGTWGAGDSDPSIPYKSPFETGGCVNGCQVEMTDVGSCWSYPPSTATFCSYKTKTTGSTCTAGPGSPAPGVPPTTPPKREDVPPFKPPAGQPCPSGTVQAGTDSAGTPICMGTGSDPKNSDPPPPKIESEKTTTNPDGSVTTTKTTTTTNADGSTTTVIENVTKMPDGSTKTDTSKDTSNTPDGKAGKDDSQKADEKYDLCKQNPMLNICRNSSVSGSCGEISCEGDAIQCATLRAAAAMQCKQKEDEDKLNSSSLKAKGEAAINGTDLDGLPSPKTAQKLTIPGVEAQGWLGNGQTFQDVSVTVQGHVIKVPLSEWTGYLVGLRYALMIVASMISFRVLGGAILKE